MMTDDRFNVELKGLDSVDLPGLDDQPDDPTNARIEVTARVGPVDDDRGDDFTLFFVTPKWLSDNVPPCGWWAPRYEVVLPAFSWSLAERAVAEILAGISADSWDAFAEAFSRIAYWEYSGDEPPA